MVVATGEGPFNVRSAKSPGMIWELCLEFDMIDEHSVKSKGRMEADIIGLRPRLERPFLDVEWEVHFGMAAWSGGRVASVAVSNRHHSVRKNAYLCEYGPKAVPWF